MKKVIVNGLIISYDKTSAQSLSIENGCITEIAENIDTTGAEIIDAQNCFILPGGVDMHTNLALGADGVVSEEAFKANSLGCLYGGTTCVIEELSDNSYSVEEYLNKFKSSSYVDYSVHQAYPKDNGALKQSLQKSVQGFPSYFMSMTGEHKVSDEEIMLLAKEASSQGAILFVHTESPVPISLFEELYRKKGKVSPYALASTRPNWAELEAFIRLSNLSRAGGSSFAVESISSAEVVRQIFAQVNEGLPLTMLTSPHYLLLTDDKYLSLKNFDEANYKYCVHPPLRKQEDILSLWKGINAGFIHCVISKHNGVSLEHKIKQAQGNIFNLPDICMGLPSAELRIPLLYTFGVLEKKISLNKLVEITATHVTRIAGLRSKGRIEAGTDADIVIFDPEHKKTIKAENLHDTAGYSPYEGMELQGFPRDVFLRGEHVIRDFALNKEALGIAVFRKAVAMR